MSNRDAVDKLIAGLEREHLGEFDVARVEAARSLASAVDAEPFNAQLWRQYRESVEVLLPDASGDDALDELIGDLLAPVRHAED